jgi:hypothetical protein
VKARNPLLALPGFSNLRKSWILKLEEEKELLPEHKKYFEMKPF